MDEFNVDDLKKQLEKDVNKHEKKKEWSTAQVVISGILYCTAFIADLLILAMLYLLIKGVNTNTLLYIMLGSTALLIIINKILVLSLAIVNTRV